MGKVRIVYLGCLADAAGTGDEEVELPSGVGSTDALMSCLRPHLSQRLAGPTIRTVVNGTMINGSAPIEPGDEIAFFPPTSGG